MYRFGQNRLLAGHTPLWNPMVLCGQPYIGNPQMGVFYPATLLLPFCSIWTYISITVSIHLFLCGAFTYRFLTRWTMSRNCALIGALVFEGSGCLLGRMQFPPMIFSLAYFPLLFICLDAAIDRPRFRSWLGLCVTVGLLILAAHPQVAYLSLASGAAYVLMRLLRRVGRRPADYERNRALVRLLLPAVTALLGGILLASIQLLPTLQLIVESPREELSAAQANRFVLNPAQLLTLIEPHAFGTPAAADYWGSGNAWEPTLFVGWLPLILIGYAVIRCGSERVVRFWAVLSLLAIWLAIGNVGGLYWLAFHSVPGLSNFHDPARFLILTVFAFAVLSAIGLDALQAREAWCSRRVVIVAGALVALPLWIYSQDWLPTVSPRALAHVPSIVTRLRGNAGTAHLGSGRTYLPTHDLYWRHFITEGYSDYGAADPRSLATVIDTLMPNLGMRYGIESASAYEPVPLNGPADVDGLGRIALRRNEPNLERLLALMDVQFVLLPRPYHLASAGIEADSAGTDKRRDDGWLRILTNRDDIGRAWLVRQTRRVLGTTRITAALASPDFDPRITAILTDDLHPGEPDLEWGISGALEEAKKNVQIQSYTAEAISLWVDAGNRPGYLVCSISAYPGWYATVDGRRTPLHRTDGAIMGLFLQPGRHQIEIRYRPQSFLIGQYLTLLACCILAGLTGWFMIERLRPHKALPNR